MAHHTVFHGTSSLFIPSIMHHGLGGIDPIEKFHIRELMSFLFRECETKIPADDNFRTIRTTALAMTHQARFFKHEKDPKGQLHNFRHGSTYVTSIEKGAVVYACNSPFGSELLSACVQLIQILTRAGIPVNIPRDLNEIDLQRVIDTKHLPVVVEVSGVAITDLLTENGVPAMFDYHFKKTHLEWLDEEKYIDLQKSFELTSIIPAARLKLKRVLCPGKIVDANFDYELKDIISA